MFDCFCRHYLFYLIHCQLLNEEEPDDINAYERFVLNKFLASDISWMPVGKALTMPGSHNNNAAEENKHGSGGGAAHFVHATLQADVHPWRHAQRASNDA